MPRSLSAPKSDFVSGVVRIEQIRLQLAPGRLRISGDSWSQNQNKAEFESDAHVVSAT
jgi:hypothetical protein